MSFQSSSPWLPNCSSSLVSEKGCCGSSTRSDNKRGHQWFLDALEEGLYINKKQAIESLKDASGRTVIDSSLWLDGPISQLGCPTSDQLSRLKPVQSSDFLNRNIICSTESAAVDGDKSDFVNQSGNDSSVAITMSQAMEDPLCLNTGLRKVKVNQVRMSENYLHELVGNSCHGGNDQAMRAGYHSQRTADNMISLPTYNIADGNTMSVNPAFSKMDKNFVSVGQTSDKRDDSFMLTNQFYNGMDKNVQSLSQAFNCGNYNSDNVGERYVKENSSFTSIGGPTYSKQNFFSVDPYYKRVNESFMPTGSAYNEEQRHSLIPNQQNAPVASLQALYNKENSSILSMVDNLGKGDQTTISFGGFQDKPEEGNHYNRLIISYGNLLSQPSVQSPGALGVHDSVEQLNANVTSVATGRTDGAQKNKEPKAKKGLSNNFPTNVKGLLSTGIFDGVPVKYASWSREKKLRGVVTGTGYLCGCQYCKLSKVVNAYEFECHAGCKTKHPNNHIYFENGKTIYAVVQELKNTPQDKLFDVIPNVTGSAINQKNFDAWKTSYRAATRELQRIYGTDDVVVPS